MAKTQKPAALTSDPEDCFDAEYIRETGRRGFGSGGREQMEQSADMSGTIGSAMNLGDNPEEDIVVDALDAERDIKPFEKEFMLPGGQMLGLDQAVLKSIERCRKLFPNFFIFYLSETEEFFKKKKQPTTS
jgi:actin-related protein 8